MLQRTTRVTTASGKIVLKSQCCTINGEYYIKDKEAVKVGTTWFLMNDPRIFFDHANNIWRRTRGVMIAKGIVGYDAMKNPIIGTFENNPLRNIEVIEVGSNGTPLRKILYMDSSLLKDKVVYNKNLGRYEDMSREAPVFRYVDNLLAQTIGHGTYSYTISQEYSSSKHMSRFLGFHRDMTINNPINRDDVAELGDFSFGLEFETSAGKISQSDCFKLGLIPLHDGSITGIEYTTIPMQGVEGFNLLINQIKCLQNNTYFDKDCSLHLHLGGYPIDAKSIWALYKLLVIIEPQIARIMPMWAFNTARFKTKQKDYCKKLMKASSLEEYYTYCSGDRMRFDGCLTYPHPMDEEDRAKWNIHARYVWANLINLLFKKTGKTVEFRIHAPTFNIQKIINWIFICAAILKYAIVKKDTLLTTRFNEIITLEDIITKVYSPRIASQLKKYIEFREIYFNLLGNKYSDPAGLIDLQTDKDQNFKTNIVTNVR